MPDKVDCLIQKAENLLNKNNFQGAIILCEEILCYSPNQVDALHIIGLCNARLGNMDDALNFFKLALIEEPENSVLENNLANVYKNFGDIESALHHYQRALEIKADYAQAHNNIATVYVAMGDDSKALHHYHKAITVAPDFTAAHFNLGLLFLKQGELGAAKTQFNNVISLYPDHVEAGFYLGALYLNEGKLDEAQLALEDVLRIDAEHVQSLVNLGVIAIKREQGQQAVNHFTQALAFDNENIEARNNLAATFLHYDRFENALMHYDVLLDKDKTNIEYLYNAGVAQMALGHLPEARLHFETVINLQSDHFAALNNLAAICCRLNHKDEAINLLKRAQQVNPNDAAGKFMLAAMTGSNNKQPACSEYVKNLFENYAINYDQHMQHVLNYSLPNEIGKILHNVNYSIFDRVLDLGCGTGLSGIVMREQAKHLTGVDISAKMLAQAKEKDVYDLLVEDEVIHFLGVDSQRYELIVAADVLPYLGELDYLFNLIKSKLSAGGLFLFTIEVGEENPWGLQSTARFHHHPDYIASCIKANSLKIKYQDKIVGREQEHKPVYLMVYAVEK